MLLLSAKCPRHDGRSEKLRMNEDLRNLSKDQLFDLVHWWNTSLIPRETKREFINSERKYYLESF